MISTVLTISTSHVKPATRAMLETISDTAGYGLAVYDKDGFGWFIYLDSPDTIDMDGMLADYPDLHACVKAAVDLGVDILCLDNDASELPGLAVYEG